METLGRAMGPMMKHRTKKSLEMSLTEVGSTPGETQLQLQSDGKARLVITKPTPARYL